jgi:hypothetical protein
VRPANGAGWRLFVAALALVAFAFQSYVTQTHIHLASGSAGHSHTTAAIVFSSAVKGVSGQKSAPKNQTPGNDEPVKCPLCQAVGYAGHFVTPSAASALLLPATAISILPLLLALVPAHETPSHNWRGRAPPHS